MTTRYHWIPTVKLDIPADVIDPAVRYAATEAFYAARARCADRCATYRRDAVEIAAWTIYCCGFGAWISAGARRVRAAI